MTEVESFIIGHEQSQRVIMSFLHRLLTTQFDLVAKIRYGIPFYYRRSWICYLNPTKTGQIEFAFTRGNELSNVQGILEDRGRKQVLSTILDNIVDVPEQAINEIIQEAILLDDQVPYRSTRKGVPPTA